MNEWEQLSDRTTPGGQTLRTERAEIDGQTWYIGNIPPLPEQPTRAFLLGFRQGWRAARRGFNKGLEHRWP